VHPRSLIRAGLALLISVTAMAEEVPPLIPLPQRVEWQPGYFAPEAIALRGGAAVCGTVGTMLAGAGFAAGPGGVVELVIGPVPEASAPGESYRLSVRPEGVRITAPEEVGLFYGAQTLRQLIRTANGRPAIRCCEITDWPAFPWRGFMHDVGRNPQDVQLLKRFLDVMAQYKMNVFHFHLTDNPGYRVECRVHPELNDPKFMTPTRRPGFFYTYSQINDLAAYCRERGIALVPEIDMPGHSEYFKRAFGVDMQSEQGEKILAGCVNEFLDNVHTEYFHMGSDEVRLQNAGFMDRMADLIRERGRKLIVWRPGHMPKGKVMTQLWAAGGKNDWPLKGVPTIDSRNDYVNHMDPFDGPVRIMNLGTAGLGGILCHWPDNNAGEQMNIYRQSPVFPSLLAAAERYWTGRTPNRPEYWGRLSPDFGEFEQRLLAHRDQFFRDWPFPYVKQTDIVWKIGDVEARGATVHINHFWFEGWLPKAKTGTAHAQTHVWSPRAQTVGFWINFNGPSRSGRDSPNPAKGQWSNTGSRVWVNDVELPPPDWKQPGARGAEIPFVDEDYFYRPPTQVALKQGWNKIVIDAARTAGIRKWMFTCVPVQADGDCVREVPELRFAVTPEIAAGTR
jgi:hexosaminidase